MAIATAPPTQRAWSINLLPGSPHRANPLRIPKLFDPGVTEGPGSHAPSDAR
jgi:hypothetical protein